MIAWDTISRSPAEQLPEMVWHVHFVHGQTFAVVVKYLATIIIFYKDRWFNQVQVSLLITFFKNLM